MSVHGAVVRRQVRHPLPTACGATPGIGNPPPSLIELPIQEVFEGYSRQRLGVEMLMIGALQLSNAVPGGGVPTATKHMVSPRYHTKPSVAGEIYPSSNVEPHHR